MGSEHTRSSSSRAWTARRTRQRELEGGIPARRHARPIGKIPAIGISRPREARPRTRNLTRELDVLGVEPEARVDGVEDVRDFRPVRRADAELFGERRYPGKVIHPRVGLKPGEISHERAG